MKSSVYRDIIDDKVSEWRNKLTKLEAQLASGSGDDLAMLDAKIKALRKHLDNAVVQLLILDKSETVENTMETKDKILEIFNSVDQDFPHYDTLTPYML